MTPKELYETHKGKKAESYGAKGIIVGYDSDEKPNGPCLIIKMITTETDLGWSQIDPNDIIEDENKDEFARFLYVFPGNVID